MKKQLAECVYGGRDIIGKLIVGLDFPEIKERVLRIDRDRIILRSREVLSLCAVGMYGVLIS